MPESVVPPNSTLREGNRGYFFCRQKPKNKTCLVVLQNYTLFAKLGTTCIILQQIDFGTTETHVSVVHDSFCLFCLFLFQGIDFFPIAYYNAYNTIDFLVSKGFLEKKKEIPQRR